MPGDQSQALDIRELLRLLDLRETRYRRQRLGDGLNHAEIQSSIEGINWSAGEDYWERRLYLHPDSRGLLLEIHDHAIVGEDEFEESYFVLVPKSPGAKPIVARTPDFPIIDQIGSIE